MRKQLSLTGCREVPRGKTSPEAEEEASHDRRYHDAERVGHSSPLLAALRRPDGAEGSAVRTIRKHFAGILAYVTSRRTNAFVEGVNNRLRMIARRAYGFHSHVPLIAMLFPCCGRIMLSSPLPGPTQP